VPPEPELVIEPKKVMNEPPPEVDPIIEPEPELVIEPKKKKKKKDE
jgi:hypothetical protein